MQKFWRFLKDNIRHQEIVLVALLVGTTVLCVPLQHYMWLSRYQHYSFSLIAIGIGLLLQTGASWRRISRWGKLTLIGSSVYVLCCAQFFWFNPWLANPDLATDDQLWSRTLFAICLGCFVMPLVYCWRRWRIDTKPQGLGLAPNQEQVRP